MSPAPRCSPDDPATVAIASSALAGLPADVIKALCEGTRRVRIEAGSTVHGGDVVRPHFDLVMSGMVRAHVTAADGRSLTFRYCRAGAIVGAATLFADDPPAFALQALSGSELLRFEPDVVRDWAHRDVRVARALLAETSERVLRFVGELSETTFSTVRERVCRHLLDLAAEHQQGAELVVEVSQQQLADAVGSVREVVVRVLRELREEGIVETRRNEIRIIAPEELVAPSGHGQEHRFLTRS